MWAYIQYKNSSVPSDPRKPRVPSDPRKPRVPSDPRVASVRKDPRSVPSDPRVPGDLRVPSEPRVPSDPREPVYFRSSPVGQVITRATRRILTSAHSEDIKTLRYQNCVIAAA